MAGCLTLQRAASYSLKTALEAHINIKGVAMARGMAIGFAAICMVAMGAVGQASQAKPAATAKAQAGNAAAKALKNPVPADATSIAQGKAVFTKYCQTCHGPLGKGDGPGTPKDVHPANLASGKFMHGGSDGEIFTTIKTGVPPKFDMDSWDGRIPDKDIWNLVNYIRTLGPKGAKK
jgi:mono/diheme cytochrome c family protein